jgi:predicted Zn-dependent peptidase
MGSIKTIEEEVELVDAVTAHDIRRVATEVLRTPIQMAVIGPFAKDAAFRAAVGA